MVEEEMAKAAAVGITSLVEYGVLGGVAAISISFVALLCIVIIRFALLCVKDSKETINNNTAAIASLEKSLSSLLNGIQVTLAEIKASRDR